MLLYINENAATEHGVGGNGWMRKIDGETPITAINIPGTHDSATEYVSFAFVSRTQALSIAEQLEAGVRYFDMRFEKTENGFKAVHSLSDCREGKSIFSEKLTAEKIIGDCSAFLSENPSETILFQLREDDGDAGDSFFESFYELFIKNNPDLWFCENRIPKLGEVRGKIVLLRVGGIDGEKFTDKNSGINFSMYPYIDGMKKHDYRREDIKTLGGTAYCSMYVQDSYQLLGRRKLAAIEDFLASELDRAEFNICMTNCTGILMPWMNAIYVNRRLKEYGFESGRYYGIVAADFIDPELCRMIYSSNFREAGATLIK